jgi:hypothetical protein
MYIAFDPSMYAGAWLAARLGVLHAVPLTHGDDLTALPAPRFTDLLRLRAAGGKWTGSVSAGIVHVSKSRDISTPEARFDGEITRAAEAP